MPLDQKAIDELKEIYRKEYGEDLSDEEAMGIGNRLLRVFTWLLRPRGEGDTEEKT